jgi:hypothetical protein
MTSRHFSLLIYFRVKLTDGEKSAAIKTIMIAKCCSQVPQHDPVDLSEVALSDALSAIFTLFTIIIDLVLPAPHNLYHVVCPNLF